MHDHGLFQAVCRVNRLDGEDKDFGYIVDYKELFKELSSAVNKYTSDAFAGYDDEDVNGLVKDRLSEGRRYFDATLDELDELCDGVPAPKGVEEYRIYFCGIDGIGGIDDEFCTRIRQRFYRLVNRLIRGYADIKGEMDAAGYSQSQQIFIDDKVSFYTHMKDEISLASGDFIDLKAYEADMRWLIDTYIKADDSRSIGKFDDFTLLDFVIAQAENLDGESKAATAEAIENNIRRSIVEKILINPKYYEKMSEILDELVRERREGAIVYELLLEHYLELVKNAQNPENNPHYPENIRHSGALRALYDNCGEDADLAIALDKAVRESIEDDFRHNEFKERRVKQALYAVLLVKFASDAKAQSEVERIYSIIVEQGEY